MSDMEKKLSAFLDGELPEAEAREMEAALERDAELQAQLDSLMAADTLAKDELAIVLAEPVPLELAAAVRNAPDATPANEPAAPARRGGWLSAVAAVLFLTVGGAGGYYAGLSQNAPKVSSTPVWLAAVADYHAVYAGQKRHLVEVPASEADHIQTWLTATLGSDVSIPDLSASGLTFQGARLLVAAGKPVSQLMYTDAAGNVVALCQITTATPAKASRPERLTASKWSVGVATMRTSFLSGQKSLRGFKPSQKLQPHKV